MRNASGFVPDEKGMRDLLNSEGVKKDLQRRMTRALRQARESAPVVTGQLRDSHTVVVEHTKDRVRVRLYNTAPYARQVAATNPWLSTALDQAGGD